MQFVDMIRGSANPAADFLEGDPYEDVPI